MSIGSRIKERRNALSLTQEDLAKALGVTKGAVANYENGVSIPKPDILFNVISKLQCDANYLFQDMIDVCDDSQLTVDELDFIVKYRKLDKNNKQLVDCIVDKAIDIQSTAMDIPVMPNIKHYSAILYDFPVSAGTGERPDATNASIVEIEEEPPRGTDYILRIAGNSMEPEYGDGDYVYVESTTTLNFGDVGIFAYEGSTYMKLYTESGLKSLNPNYALIQGEDIHILGKVLGVVEGNIK